MPQQQAASSANKRLDIVSDPEKANRVLLLLHLVQMFGFSLISFALPSHVQNISESDPRLQNFQESKLFDLVKECLK